MIGSMKVRAMLIAAVASVSLIPPTFGNPSRPVPAVQNKPAVDVNALRKLHINTLRNMIRDHASIPADVKAGRVKLTKVQAIEILSRAA